jgi:hypothetical protein
MPRSLFLTLLAGAFFVATSSFATSSFASTAESASPAPPAPKPAAHVWDRPLAFDVHGGLGTPVGFGGFTVDVAPVPWLAVSGGLGWGRGGLQEAGTARLRIPINHFAISFGGGTSTGAYDANEVSMFGESTSWHWKRAWWANFEGSIEFRDDNGVELRGYAGWAHLTNPVADGCERDGSTMCSNAAGGLMVTSFPYAGLAVGYAFDL